MTQSREIKRLDADWADTGPPTSLQLGRGWVGRGVQRPPAEDGVNDSALPSAGLAGMAGARLCLAILSKALALRPIR
jgi:hypothetical protein